MDAAVAVGDAGSGPAVTGGIGIRAAVGIAFAGGAAAAPGRIGIGAAVGIGAAAAGAAIARRVGRVAVACPGAAAAVAGGIGLGAAVRIASLEGARLAGDQAERTRRGAGAGDSGNERSAADLAHGAEDKRFPRPARGG